MKIKLPELGEGIESAKVVSILVSEGDVIGKEDDVIEVETDKAVAGVPASSGGKVTKILVAEGDDVSVGDALVEVDENADDESSDKKDTGDEGDDAVEKEDGATEKDDTTEEEDAAEEASDDESEEDKSSGETGAEDNGSDEGQDGDAARKSAVGPPAGPELRQMARDLGIDLERVRGLGRGGRISIDDLRAYISKLQKKVFEEGEAGSLFEDLSQYGPIHSEELSGIRRTISKRLLERWRQSPLVTQFGEAGLEKILELKGTHEEKDEESGPHLSLSCFFLHVLSRMLKVYPQFNTAIDLDAGKVVFRDYIHIGIAVDTDNGLMVPVVRDADKLSLRELADALASISKKAREGKLSAEDSAGASFYFSNQGAIGGGHFTPLLSGTESAILGVGKGRAKVVPDGDGYKTITSVPLSLSYDHRAIDGAQAAAFIDEFEKRLEDFDETALEDSDGSKGEEAKK